jgi:diketogulonate reductase-like aldo/keto reductase
MRIHPSARPVASRREFLTLLSTLPVVGLAPSAAIARATMPTRAVPSSGERLPVVGLGSSKVVEEIAKNGEEPVRQVLRALVAGGGKVVDTWPRNQANDDRFGTVLGEPGLRDALFVTTKIDKVGKDVGIAQFRQAQKSYGKKTIDLVQIFSLTDLDTHWPSLRAWKDAGEARYIGVTVSEPRLHDALEQFLKRERPDFTQVNYSITERASEDRLLPLAADRGVAVLINRPFMNGAYFKRLEGKPLPPWAAEVGCTTWAQFSLKYILGHPAVTCILTETSNPHHMEENAQTALGALPDANVRARMRKFIATV